MTNKPNVSRRAAMAKIAGLTAVGYFAPTMAVMADGHSAASASSASSASSVSSVSSASSAASTVSEPSASEASDWSAPSIGESGNAEIDAKAQTCADSSTSEASFAECLSRAGLRIAG